MINYDNELEKFRLYSAHEKENSASLFYSLVEDP